MVLQNLSVINYRNIEQADLAFSDGVNCFLGPNGVGKTNLLDAIYYLSFCKSHLNPTDTLNIRHEAEFFVIQGEYLRNENVENIYCGLKRAQKKQFKRNKKEYSKLSEHIGLLPLVQISPADNRLITDGSDERRKFVDGVISQYNHSYLDTLIKYNRLLLQRNTLLKQLQERNSADYDLVEIIDSQLSFEGDKIAADRTGFFQRLLPVFSKYYAAISGEKEQVGLTYCSHTLEGDMIKQWSDTFAKDRILGYTTKGIHKDDLEFTLDAFPLKRVASQGQQKTFTVALKLAQYEFMLQQNGIKPILLMDDIFDKLDSKRVERIIQLVSIESFGQKFITDTNREHLDAILSEMQTSYAIFEVHNGNNINQVKSNA